MPIMPPLSSMAGIAEHHPSALSRMAPAPQPTSALTPPLVPAKYPDAPDPRVVAVQNLDLPPIGSYLIREDACGA